MLVTNSRYKGEDSVLQQAAQELRRDGIRLYVIASDKPDGNRLQTVAAKEDITRITRFLGADESAARFVKYIRDQDKGKNRLLVVTFMAHRIITVNLRSTLKMRQNCFVLLYIKLDFPE